MKKKYKRNLFFIQVKEITFEIDSKIGCGELVMIRYFGYTYNTFLQFYKKTIPNNCPKVFCRTIFKRGFKMNFKMKD